MVAKQASFYKTHVLDAQETQILNNLAILDYNLGEYV